MKLLLVIYALIIAQCEGRRAKQIAKKPVEFDEVIKGTVSFSAAGFGATWVSPTEMTYTRDGNLTIFDMTTMSARVLFDKSFSVS